MPNPETSGKVQLGADEKAVVIGCINEVGATYGVDYVGHIGFFMHSALPRKYYYFILVYMVKTSLVKSVEV